MSSWQQFQHARNALSSTPLPGISLDAAGLVALADLPTIARRTALMGTSTFLDMFVLCPGLHRQQNASELNRGELPATAAMTTGFVFRIENQATVAYLQSIGKTARLVTVAVEKPKTRSWRCMVSPDKSILAFLLYSLNIVLTLAAFSISILLEDWWTMTVLIILVLARLLNIIVIRRRAVVGWHGALEPGKNGDLLVLLSQDRWIRIQGTVDSLKTVTSGQWLRDETFLESAMEATATMLVYIDAVITPNASQTGNIVLIMLLLSSALLLAICNDLQKSLHMHGHVLRVTGISKQYARRLDLAKELIAESGRDDWAIRLGMINAPTPKEEVVL